MPDIPDEYLPSITDYCIARFLLRKGNRKEAREMMAIYLDSLDECKEVYASPTSNPNIHNLYDGVINQFDIPPQSLT